VRANRRDSTIEREREREIEREWERQERVTRECMRERVTHYEAVNTRKSNERKLERVSDQGKEREIERVFDEERRGEGSHK
jgi:hypothetical protein